MKQKSGIGNVEELAGTTTEWEEQEREQEVYEEEGKEVTGSLEQSLKEAEQQLPEKDNPLGIFSEIKTKGMFWMTVRRR